MLPGRNDAEMGPANSLHALVYCSEYNERFDFDFIHSNQKEQMRGVKAGVWLLQCEKVNLEI